MGKHNPFRKTSRAGSVLDVNRVFERELRLPGSSEIHLRRSEPARLDPSRATSRAGSPHREKQAFSNAADCASQATLLTLRDLGTDLLKHCGVIRALEVRLKEKRVRAGLLQCVGQFPSSIGRIEFTRMAPIAAVAN